MENSPAAVGRLSSVDINGMLKGQDFMWKDIYVVHLCPIVMSVSINMSNSTVRQTVIAILSTGEIIMISFNTTL